MDNIDPLEAIASRAFSRVADARQSSGNYLRILCDGPETFAAWLQAIDRASATVHLENYILQEDVIGEAFSGALIDAQRRGVACKVLYDWLGCLTRTSRPFWRRLSDAGVQVRQYNAPRFANPLRLISRDHRKVLCVDGAVAFTGGLCIGHDWVGDPARGIPPWRDTAVEIHGPAVAHVEAAFLDSWASVVGPGSPPPSESQPDMASLSGGSDVSVIAGRPEAMGLYRLEQLVAEVAERSLWLTDGYFVATTGYVRALAGAARAGVDVRLLVPGSSNWPLVGALSKSAYRPLLQAGVRVFEWNGPMLHAKTAVADGCWTRIGSSNSNLASWVSNRELDVTIKDRALARQMEDIYLADLQGSTEVVLSRRRAIQKPVSAADGQKSYGVRTMSGRLLSGVIGLGSTLVALLSQRRNIQREEALVIYTGGTVLVLLALIAFFFPRVISWTIALIAVWSGINLLIKAWRLWSSGDEIDK